MRSLLVLVVYLPSCSLVETTSSSEYLRCTEKVCCLELDIMIIRSLVSYRSKKVFLLFLLLYFVFYLFDVYFCKAKLMQYSLKLSHRWYAADVQRPLGSYRDTTLL